MYERIFDSVAILLYVLVDSVCQRFVRIERQDVAVIVDGQADAHSLEMADRRVGEPFDGSADDPQRFQQHLEDVGDDRAAVVNHLQQAVRGPFG